MCITWSATKLHPVPRACRDDTTALTDHRLFTLVRATFGLCAREELIDGNCDTTDTETGLAPVLESTEGVAQATIP